MASSIASHREPLLLYLLTHALLHLCCSCSLIAAAQSRSNLPPCEPEQALALLRLKASFPATNHSTSSSCALGSWPAGADCCHWEGVRCGYVVPRYAGGQVVYLDLSNCACGPEKRVSLDAVALFNLPSLRHVNRACGNDDGFDGSSSSSKLPPQVSELRVLKLPRNLNRPSSTRQGMRHKKN
ncbi:unnamed protein product [Urochloa humidicola]